MLSDSILSSFAWFPQVVRLGSTVEKARRDLDAVRSKALEYGYDLVGVYQ